MSPTAIAEPLPSFKDAYRAARETHDAAAAEASVEKPAGKPVETGEPDLGHEEIADDGDPVLEAAEAIEGEEAEEAETPGRRGADAEIEPTLVSAKDLKALQTKYADNPGRLLAELNKAWTQKTQGLAEARKQYDRLKDYVPLFEALEADPQGAIERLAAHFDIPLAAAAKVVETASTEKKGSAAAVASVVESELASVRADLGPELEYLADGLVPAITKMVERLVGKTVDEQVKPLRAAQESQITRAASEETVRVMADLETRHPDFKTHEPAMLALAKTLDPHGLTEAAYLDVLYDVVTSRSGQQSWKKDQAALVAAEVKKTIAKMEQDAGRGRGRTARATPEAQVTKQSPARPTFRESYAAAKAGERFE